LNFQTPGVGYLLHFTAPHTRNAPMPCLWRHGNRAHQRRSDV
jgi:hypothetical protein